MRWPHIYCRYSDLGWDKNDFRREAGRAAEEAVANTMQVCRARGLTSSTTGNTGDAAVVQKACEAEAATILAKYDGGKTDKTPLRARIERGAVDSAAQMLKASGDRDEAKKRYTESCGDCNVRWERKEEEVVARATADDMESCQGDRAACLTEAAKRAVARVAGARNAAGGTRSSNMSAPLLRAAVNKVIQAAARADATAMFSSCDRSTHELRQSCFAATKKRLAKYVCCQSEGGTCL